MNNCQNDIITVWTIQVLNGETLILSEQEQYKVSIWTLQWLKRWFGRNVIRGLEMKTNTERCRGSETKKSGQIDCTRVRWKVDWVGWGLREWQSGCQVWKIRDCDRCRKQNYRWVSAGLPESTVMRCIWSEVHPGFRIFTQRQVSWSQVQQTVSQTYWHNKKECESEMKYILANWVTCTRRDETHTKNMATKVQTLDPECFPTETDCALVFLNSITMIMISNTISTC